MGNCDRLYSMLLENNKCVRILGLGNGKGKSILDTGVAVQAIIVDKYVVKIVNSKLLKFWCLL